MKLDLEMDKKLNINPIQDPKEKKLADKVKRKAAFEKNLDPDGYFWTNGFWFMKRYSSQTCLVSAAGHHRAETRKLSWGESRPVNGTMRWIWDTLN